MEEPSPAISAVLRATRRRLRVQAGFAGFAIAIGPAAPLAFAAIELGRPLAAIAIGAGVALVTLACALRRHGDLDVAARIDRACGLADRLRTAVALARTEDRAATVPGGPYRGVATHHDPIAAGLVRAAIRDGALAALCADPKRAAPYRWPAASVVALGLVAATVAVSLTSPRLPALVIRDAREAPPRVDVEDVAVAYTPFDLGHARAVLEVLHQDPATAPIACRLEAALDRLAASDLDKTELLLELGRALHEAGLDAGKKSLALDDAIETLRRLRPHARPRPRVASPPPVSPSGAHEDHGFDTSRHRDGAISVRSDVATRDVDLQGVAGRGPSHREAIEVAAQRGFASAPYRQVYTRYAAALEDTMHAEALPSSYRYYVSRYFYAIRPEACPD
jgi:hypothetical protein